MIISLVFFFKFSLNLSGSFGYEYIVYSNEKDAYYLIVGYEYTTLRLN